MTNAKAFILSAQNAASLHDTDFHIWAKQQADLVRSGRFDDLDRDHLIDEIEDLGEIRSP